MGRLLGHSGGHIQRWEYVQGGDAMRDRHLKKYIHLKKPLEPHYPY